MAHKNVYRYRFRRPRYVQWDGSMNQPTMPYMNDTGTDVINGTFKRNCNSTPQLKWGWSYFLHLFKNYINLSSFVFELILLFNDLERKRRFRFTIQCKLSINNLSNSYWNEFVLDVWVVFCGVNFSCNGWDTRFDLCPTINFNSKMLFHNVSVCIANSDCSTLFYNLELAVSSNKLAAAKLIAYEALSNLIKLLTIVTLALADNFDWVNT
jgi:hypothetical protein